MSIPTFREFISRRSSPTPESAAVDLDDMTVTFYNDEGDELSSAHLKDVAKEAGWKGHILRDTGRKTTGGSHPSGGSERLSVTSEIDPWEADPSNEFEREQLTEVIKDIMGVLGKKRGWKGFRHEIV